MESITPTELAEEFHTDPKRVRKFLRSQVQKADQPGRGHRWEIPGGKRNLNRLRKQYDEWAAAHTRQRTA